MFIIESTEKQKAKQKRTDYSKHFHFGDHPFRAVVLNPRAILPSRGHLAMSRDIFYYYWQVVLLASSA